MTGKRGAAARAQAHWPELKAARHTFQRPFLVAVSGGGAFMLLVAVRIGLLLAGFRLTDLLCRALGRAHRRNSAPSRSDRTQVAQTICRLVFSVAHRTQPRATCLARALVIRTLLEQKNVSVAVRFGARHHNGRFEAHAWVELHGQSLDDPSAQAGPRFMPFALSDPGPAGRGLRFGH